jgi:hypothetical protein
MSDTNAITVTVRKEVQNGMRTLAQPGDPGVEKSIGAAEFGGAQPYSDPNDVDIYSIISCRRDSKDILYYVEETVTDITSAWTA